MREANDQEDTSFGDGRYTYTTQREREKKLDTHIYKILLILHVFFSYNYTIEYLKLNTIDLFC